MRPNVDNAPNAQEIYKKTLADLSPVQREALEKTARLWDDMTQYQLKLLVEGKKITQEEADAMMAAHPHYAKMRRESADIEKSFEFLRTSRAASGKPKVRAGSIEYDPPTHVMQNTFTQAHRNAAAAQQNLAALHLYGLVKDNPDFWKNWYTTEEKEVHHLTSWDSCTIDRQNNLEILTSQLQSLERAIKRERLFTSSRSTGINALSCLALA